ncbi:hypothetical protein NX059_003751 [Plenodomus lindquistii]|nr:hypothetical protein NX059_003751 [Plenodomus lindquistii]
MVNSVPIEAIDAEREKAEQGKGYVGKGKGKLIVGEAKPTWGLGTGTDFPAMWTGADSSSTCKPRSRDVSGSDMFPGAD